VLEVGRLARGWVTGLFSRILTWDRESHVLNQGIDEKSAPENFVVDSILYRSKGSFTYDQSNAIFLLYRKIDSSSPSGNPSDASDKTTKITNGRHRTQDGRGEARA
jgi:hypothetical protein